MNNEFYKDLGDKWFTSQHDAVALLRIENYKKLPWVLKQIQAQFKNQKCRVLDVGCGGGFLTLELAKRGYVCTGVDVDMSIMKAGKERDETKSIQWCVAPAEKTPFADGSFDVVCAMDMLEHVEDPVAVLKEAKRVLTPQGLLLIHTFNRTPLAWLFAAKGLDWFIKNSQKHIHDWNKFIRVSELEHELHKLGFKISALSGIGPKVLSWPMLKLIMTGKVSDDFQFRLTSNLQVGYLVSAQNGTAKPTRSSIQDAST